jgi:hypothetical protein
MDLLHITLIDASRLCIDPMDDFIVNGMIVITQCLVQLFVRDGREVATCVLVAFTIQTMYDYRWGGLWQRVYRIGG